MKTEEKRKDSLEDGVTLHPDMKARYFVAAMDGLLMKVEDFYRQQGGRETSLQEVAYKVAEVNNAIRGLIKQGKAMTLVFVKPGQHRPFREYSLSQEKTLGEFFDVFLASDD